MDRILPLLQLTYSVGTLAENGFPKGAFVLGGKYVVATRDRPVSINFLGAQGYWREVLTAEERNAGVKPRRFDTPQEAEAAGLATTWQPGKSGEQNDQVPPKVKRALDVIVLVRWPYEQSHEAPGDDLPVVGYKRHLYVPAKWFLEGSALTKTYRHLLAPGTHGYYRDLGSRIYRLSSEPVKITGGFDLPSPKLKCVGRRQLKDTLALYGEIEKSARS